MTLKEENIVNITVKAMELLHEGKIQYDNDMGFMGFTQEVISLAERFEKEYGHIDFNVGEHDYWQTIDEFSEKALLELYGPGQERVSAFHIIDEDGSELYFSVETGIGLVETAALTSTLFNANASIAASPIDLIMEIKDEAPVSCVIPPKEFDSLASERMDNTGRVAGVYEMDFKHQVFSAINIMDGWVAWNFADVAQAVEIAGRSKFPLGTLLDELQGKKLTAFTHPASDLVNLSKLPLDEQIKVVEIQNSKSTNSGPHKEPER